MQVCPCASTQTRVDVVNQMQDWKTHFLSFSLFLPYCSRWPKATVPFEFSPGIQRRPTAYIKSAMKEWMDKTCIKIVPWTPSLARELGHNVKVTIKNNERGCFSMVGKVGGLWSRSGRARQEVSSIRVGFRQVDGRTRTGHGLRISIFRL